MRTPFPRKCPRWGSPIIPPLPPSTSRKSKKLLLFMPHLPSKLLNFIPQINPFLLQREEQAAVCCFTFLFFKVMLNLPHRLGGPQGPSMPACRLVMVSEVGRAGPRLACHPGSGGPPTACKAERSFPPASCLFGILWFFKYFPRISSRGPVLPLQLCCMGGETQAPKGLGLARDRENPHPQWKLCGAPGS